MIEIRPMVLDDRQNFREHFERHVAESGRGDIHFVPFAPADTDGPKGVNFDALEIPLTNVGWQRWFIALDGEKNIIGHVDLKSGPLKSMLHRCVLGIGLERQYRGQGLGRQLMETAIRFARQAETLDWIDLRVFGHNSSARALYQSMGFSEQGVVVDAIRIHDESIEDVLMALEL